MSVTVQVGVSVEVSVEVTSSSAAVVAPASPVFDPGAASVRRQARGCEVAAGGCAPVVRWGAFWGPR